MRLSAMRWRRVLVRGPSMSPTLADGDLLLVAFGARPRAGDVVVVRWPSRPDQLSVKRAVRPDGAGWDVRGDNPYGSTDSVALGPATVLGVVRWRLWPSPGRPSARDRPNLP
jgi:nickel-type superoxide dismutase maturation protease